MSKPIPVDVIPSHVYLSQEDQATLFGVGEPMTIAGELSQAGQHVYEETVKVFGTLKRSLTLRVLGPNWEKSMVEVTPTEAAYLGLKLIEGRSGDETEMTSCRLVGPKGEVMLPRGIMIPQPHLRCSVEEAKTLRVSNGQNVSVDMMGERSQVLENVIVRVHPTFRLRLEIHQAYARDLWITRPTHARLRV
ncbi:propanediol utilization protein [Patescibacteria group bacterium]|nr:propanediol utilization protein [Patescibacteria group bacterium]